MLLTARELTRIALAERIEPNHGKGIRDAVVDLARLKSLASRAEGDVLDRGHVREEGVLLKDGVDRAKVRRNADHRAAVDADFARGRLDEPGNASQQRGFAAAAGAQKGDELAPPDLERHPGESPHGAISLDEAVDDDHIGCHVALISAGAFGGAVGYFPAIWRFQTSVSA